MKRVVGKYNAALAPAYKHGRFDSLLEVADGKALSMVDNTYQSYLNGKGVVLEAELLGVSFKDIALGTGEDEPRIEVIWYDDEKEWEEVYTYKETFVETEERWKYKWVDAKTGEEASQTITVKYQMAYTLDKVAGKLKVISAQIKKQEVEKREGEVKEFKKGLSGHPN
ncbi:MAG: hypothetical protein ACYSTI_12525 [Planctomycetota bacterium]